MPFWVGVLTPAAAHRTQIQQKRRYNVNSQIPAAAFVPLSRSDRVRLEHLCWTDGLVHGKALEEQVCDALCGLCIMCMLILTTTKEGLRPWPAVQGEAVLLQAESATADSFPARCLL